MDSVQIQLEVLKLVASRGLSIETTIAETRKVLDFMSYYRPSIDLQIGNVPQ